MESNRHTPGPWRHAGSGIQARAFDGSWKWITPNIHGGNREQATANAQLIASAPEMLQALQEVAHHADDECGFMVVVRAAIAKANGE